MFRVIKKEAIICVFLCFLGMSVALGIYAIKTSRSEPAVSDKAMPGGVSGKIILIDAGHGGADAGASANGVSEKEINLSVAKKLKEHIEANGGTVVMTREEDCSTADGKENGSWKVADLKKRKSMASEAGADIFISIHMNKFPQEKYKGAQVFYSGDNEDSRLLGEAIQKALPEILGDGNTRAAKKSDGNIFILKGVSIPSVVVECGFLSNKEEAELLKNEEYQDKVAYAICSGLTDYLINTAKGS